MIQQIDREVIEKMVGVIDGTIKLSDKDKEFFAYELNLALLNNAVTDEKVEELKHRIEELEDERDDLECEKSELEDEVEDTEELQERINELEDEVEQLKAKLEECGCEDFNDEY